MIPMRGAVLTYHSQNCGGFEYSSNDHIAFAHDLELIHKRGLPLIPLEDVAIAFKSDEAESLPHRFVALTCDDGAILDWRDYDHPEFGTQRSFSNILREHARSVGIITANLLTAFVIASEEARTAIDEGCYGGLPLSTEEWWKPAAVEGTISIQNHSWDHLHPVLPNHVLQGRTPGNFYSVDSFEEADLQVRKAGIEIRRILGDIAPKTNLFAYPYGHASSYLSEYYLPKFECEHKVAAAFTTEQDFIHVGTPRYRMPRLVCGDAWSSPSQFAELLEKLVAD